MQKISESHFTRLTQAGYKKKSSLIAEQILQLIKTGIYEPASKLPPERVIAEQMNVGRPSVREAISALHITGVLESRPGDGTYVAASPPLDFPVDNALSVLEESDSPFEVLQARKAMEIGVTHLAIKYATGQDIQRIKAAWVKKRDNARRGNYAEFIRHGRHFHRAIAEATADLEIGLLVSDAAMITEGAFGRPSEADEIKLIQVNIVAALQLAHHYAPRMGQRGKGGIIFVGSAAGYACVPYMANYSASKAYLISFGEALNYELKKKGVDVTVLCPATVETKNAEERARIKKEKGMDLGALGTGMRVTPVVTAALKALGKKPAVVPGMTNKVTVFVFKHFLTRRVTTRIFGGMIQKAFAKELLS